ncbi:AER045Cp [Eremothecium gossypii ATCC 10895]|uniref:AER045Cp n=1 Tax=Eremothecium gossypii (strain ATCC 10895 / CBS 109.51 / FGSC 9923 / NRRL Y-1056) TaxID=284811 RepID=Q757G8_EREGS|nr:AER045Cp [Eremothecium gossypii ATCC 10895]AAS52729.1 AER045Cp [Eremothecium gossypii ATCC 10895]AEY97035.1 FAER045Cp [Eremothecium gossypii FDAG1]
MDLIQGLIQPPKAPSVEATIPTLCERIESSTLLSDRRSAILGLKSFSRQYRELVVASGLKPLIGTLKRDYEDEDSVKAILETLLILFLRGEGNEDLTRNWAAQYSRLQGGKYPSPMLVKKQIEHFDQFSLWIADALTQGEDIVDLLVQLLETDSFHVRLYTIQLLGAIVTTRPEAGNRAIIAIPTGISTLVSLLDDVHDPIRDETVLLLTVLANNNSHIQKLVAFENVFDRIFRIIADEGGMRGSLVVSDCLNLLSVILRYNASNQSLFFETSNLPHLGGLLDEVLSDEEEFYWNEQRVTNLKTALSIVRRMVEPGNTTTPRHQQLFADTNILMIILRLTFFYGTPNSIRPHALLTIADMVRGSPKIQAQLGNIDVPYWDPALPQVVPSSDPVVMPVLDLLLRWILFANSIHTFDIRTAALELVKAYLVGNPELQETFLCAQIDLYKKQAEVLSTADQRTSIVAVLLGYDPHADLNPFKLFFSVDLLLFLFKSEDGNAKLRDLFRGIQDGDSAAGEEVLSSVQTVVELSVASISSKESRIPISYLSFLIVLLFEDFHTVNEFLSNDSNVKSLLNLVPVAQDEGITVKCLVVMLLGVAYEFCTSSSPLPRAQLYESLVATIGVDDYTSKIKQFKECSLFKEVVDSYFDPTFDETGLPKIYFSTYFSELFRENSYRIQSALSRSPDIDPNGKISFEAFEELQQRFTTVNKELCELSSSSMEEIHKLELDLRKCQEQYKQLMKAKQESDTQVSDLDEKLAQLKTQLDEANSKVEDLSTKKTTLEAAKADCLKKLASHEGQVNSLKNRTTQLEKQLATVSEQKSTAEAGINKMNRELFNLTKEKDSLTAVMNKLQKEGEKKLQEAEKEKVRITQLLSQRDRDIENLRNELQDQGTQKKKLEDEHAGLLKEIADLKSQCASQDSLIPKLKEKLKTLAESLKDTQNEHATLQKQVGNIQATSHAEITQLNAELQKLKDENVILISRKDELTQELEKLQAQTAAGEKQTSDIALLNTQKSELSAKLSRAEKELVNQKAKAEGLFQERAELKDKLNTSEKQLQESSQKLSNAQSELNEIRSRLKANEHDLITSRQEAEKLKKQNQQQSSKKDIHKLDELSKEADSYKAQVSKLSAELESTMGQLQKSSVEQTDRIENLIKENKDLNTTIATLEKEKKAQVVVNAHQENARANNKAVVDNKQKAKSQPATPLVNSKVQELEEQLEALQRKCSEMETLQKEVKELKENATQLESERDDLMLLVSDLDEKNQKYRSRLEELGHPVSSDEEDESEIDDNDEDED